MESRGQKRAEIVDELPADKRACSSMEFRASSSGSSSVHTHVNSTSRSGDMDTSSEDGEIERDSPYNSCDSEDEDPRHSLLRECQMRRSSGDRGKLERILTNLKDECDPSGQLAALTELCDLLNYCTEDSFSGQMSDALSPLLVKLSDYECNPDMMILAIRAMTYMCDVYPRASSFLIRHDAVPTLCGKLVAIEYLDVAEQCLQALEKISRNQPLACLEAGAVMAVLRYIDFFSTSVQRVAVSTVVNISKKLPSECPPSFVEAVPILCNLLQYEDNQLVENVAMGIIKIAERVSPSSESLDELCQHGLIQQVTRLINLNSRASLSKATYNGFIGLLTKLCSGSILAFRTLHELNISNILKDLFYSHDISHGRFLPLTADGQVHEVLRLLHELLPVSGSSEDAQQVSDKESFLISKPDLLLEFAKDMLPLLFQVVDSGSSIYVCYGCLSVIEKLVYLSKSDMLVQSLKNANIASFLAGVLSQKDPHVRILALQIANVILQRHSDAFLNAFVKEGIFFAIDAISTADSGFEVMCPVVSGVQLPVDLSQMPAVKGIQQCLCYAFSTGSAPLPSELRTCKLERDSVTQLAKRMRTNYFSPESCGPELGLTDILKQLKILASRLNDLTERHFSYGPFCEQEFQHVLLEIIGKVTGKELMSTFEFIESGIVKSLVNYLYSGLHDKDNKISSDYHTLINVVDQRFELFARIFMCYSDEHAPLSVLTRKLHGALSFFENFHVVLSHAPKRRNSFAMVPNGSCVAYPSLKVRFVREEGETCLSEHSKDYVTVDPFCTLDAVEKFLWSKVNKSMTEQVTSPPIAVDQTESLPSQLPAVPKSGGNSSGCNVSTDNQYEPPKWTNLKEYESKLSQFASELEMELRQANRAGSSTFDECLTVAAQNNMHIRSEADKNLRNQNNAGTTYDGLPKLLLCLDGHPLEHKLTLYQAILQQQLKAQQHDKLGPELWSQVHTVTYKRAVGTVDDNPQETKVIESHASFMTSVYAPVDISDLEKSNSLNDTLLLLKSLEGMNRFMFHLMSRGQKRAFAEGRISNLDDLKLVIPRVPQKEFLSSKLTEKLEQQMCDHLVVSVGAMPLWCNQLMISCPFLFGFDTKCRYFRLAAFGQVPSQSQQSSQSGLGVLSDRRVSTSTSPHKKFVVSRDRILESATRVMELHARSKVPLEVEYYEEVGTGLGPTLEFYTLVSHEFQNSALGMWRKDHISFGKDLKAECSRTLLAPFGLFPRPWPSNLGDSDDIQFTEVITKFVLLGQVVAKALQEGRILDLPFSKSFYKLILGQELTIYDIPSFDPELGRTLLEFQALVERKAVMESGCGGKLLLDCGPCYRDTKVEDLCLNFTLPGYPDYVFATDPDNKMVNMSNLESYITHIVDATIHTGISRQVEAFKCGFNEVFPIEKLKIFTEEELEHLLCGEHESWNSNELLDHIKFDHGYTASSPPILNLLEIIQEFDSEQRRAFLRFVTGAPRLPLGGLVSLNPKLTIVRKHSANPADTDLPSVMTCANYLKLPPYSSKEVMKEKLLYAITEGQGSFHLS